MALYQSDVASSCVVSWYDMLWLCLWPPVAHSLLLLCLSCVCAPLVSRALLYTHTGAAFLTCLEVSLAVPQTLPANKQLRARFIAFLHRMVECLMSGVLPYLPAALEALMGSTAAHGSAAASDAVDVTDVMQLLVQLIVRFKEALAKLVEAALPVAVAKTHALLGGCGGWVCVWVGVLWLA